MQNLFILPMDFFLHLLQSTYKINSPEEEKDNIHLHHHLLLLLRIYDVLLIIDWKERTVSRCFFASFRIGEKRHELSH